jgi:hypothetical protein
MMMKCISREEGIQLL